MKNILKKLSSDKLINLENVIDNIYYNKIIKELKYDTLVLSGCSSRAFITLGCLQCAIDNNLMSSINTYIGTSSGSIISLLLIIGYTPIEMIVHLIQNNVMDTMVNFNIVNMINNSGAISYYPIQSTLEKMIISKIGYLPTLKDIKEKFKKKLVVVTYNLTLSRTEYISYEEYPDLPCITALRMSSNLPLVFEKFLYNKNFYVDGGISDNFAIKYGEKFGKKILGITLDDYQMQHKPDYNILEYMYNIISIPINEITKYSINSILKKTKIIIVKLETKINMYEFKIDNTLKLNLFSTGYQQFKEQM